MKSKYWLVLMATCLGAGNSAVQAQSPPVGNDATALRRQIEDIFRRRVRLELGLTNETAPAVMSVINAWGQRRVELERDERLFRNQLNQQLRPGFGSDPVVLERVVGALNDNRIAHAQTFRDEMRALTPLLSPLQRGLYQQLRDRLIAQILSVQGVSPALDTPPVSVPLRGRANGGGGG